MFFSSIILRISKKDTITEGEDAIGNEIQIAFKKNKLGTPYKVVSTKLLFGKGFDFYEEYFDIALNKGIITRGGAYYTIPLADGTSTKIMGKLNSVLHYKSSNDDFNTLKDFVKNSGGVETSELSPEEQKEFEESEQEE